VSRTLLSDTGFWQKLGVEGDNPNAACKEADCNLEKVLASYLANYGIPTHMYKHPGFTLKVPGDPGSWSEGANAGQLQQYNLMSRYPYEFMTTRWICGRNHVMDELVSLRSAIGAGGNQSREMFTLVVGNETIAIG